MNAFACLADDFVLNDDINQRWTVKRRPQGNVRADDFELQETPIAEPAKGEVLLQTRYLSLAPVMRSYMSGDSFAGEAPLNLGDVIHGRGVAQVVKSRHPDWKDGDVVQGQIGWQTYKCSKMTEAEKFWRMSPNGLPVSLGLGALGITGLSAWAGFINVGEPRAGERVLVSGAVGGVGSLVLQLAANVYDCQVIGIAGGDQKCALARELGCRSTIDYKLGDVGAQLADLARDGIDLYFDNVGGEILDCALDHLRPGARVVLCGSISEYTRETPFALPNYQRLRRTDSQMRGFFVYNHLNDWDRAMRQMADWIHAGILKPVEQMTHGFENMPSALAGLYAGQNIGKQLCRVRGEPDAWS